MAPIFGTQESRDQRPEQPQRIQPAPQDQLKTPARASLLGLPRELRDMIYNEVLTSYYPGTRVEVRDRRNVIQAPPRHVRTILLVCHQMYREAMPILISKTELISAHMPAFERTLGRYPYDWVKCYPRIALLWHMSMSFFGDLISTEEAPSTYVAPLPVLTSLTGVRAGEVMLWFEVVPCRARVPSRPVLPATPSLVLGDVLKILCDLPPATKLHLHITLMAESSEDRPQDFTGTLEDWFKSMVRQAMEPLEQHFAERIQSSVTVHRRNFLLSHIFGTGHEGRQ